MSARGRSPNSPPFILPTSSSAWTDVVYSHVDMGRRREGGRKLIHYRWENWTGRRPSNSSRGTNPFLSYVCTVSASRTSMRCPRSAEMLTHMKDILSNPRAKRGDWVTKMAVRGGIVLWGVWGGFPPIIGRTWPPLRREGGFGGDPPPHSRAQGFWRPGGGR